MHGLAGGDEAGQTMNVLLIHSVEALEPSGLRISPDFSKAVAFDVTGHLSGDEREKAEYCFSNMGVEILEWVDGNMTEKDEDIFRHELISWLAAVPESLRYRGQDLKELFAYKKELSLWWLTKLSQKKPNKTPVCQYGRIVFRVTEFIGRREEKPDGGDGHSEKDLFLVVSSNVAVKRIIEEAILSASSGKRGKPEIHRLGRSGGTCKGGNGCWADFKAALFKSIRAAVTSLFQLRKSYRQMVSTNLFLQGLYRGVGSRLKRSDRPVVLVSTNTSDFESVTDNASQMSWRNIYFDNLEYDLKKAGFLPVWICLSGNRPMDEATYRKSRQFVGNEYGFLFPGWGVVIGILLQNLIWIGLFTRLFLLRRLHHRFTFRDVNLGFLLFNDFKTLCFGHAASLLYHRCLFKAAFRRIRPLAVVYRKEFNSIGRIVTSAAVRGCRMMSAQHGVVNNSQIGYQYRESEIDSREAFRSDFVRHCPVPDYVLVFGKRMVEFMSRAGFPLHKIFPVGSVRHDRVVKHFLARKGREKRLDIWRSGRASLGMAEEDFVVLLCTQWQEVAADWFQMIARAIEQSGIACTLVVKPHPHFPQTEKLIRDRAKDVALPEPRVLTSEFYKLAFCSNVVVTHSSTAILDAILLRTPVILIRQEGLQNDNTLFTQSQVGDTAGTLEEMAEALTRLYSGEQETGKWENRRNAFLEYHLNNCDAGAIRRFVDLIGGRS